MRSILTKIAAGTVVAGAALLVSACGDTTTTDANTVVTNLETTDTLEGTVTDNMTVVDSAMGDNTMMANDTMMDNTAEPM